MGFLKAATLNLFLIFSAKKVVPPENTGDFFDSSQKIRRKPTETGIGNAKYNLNSSSEISRPIKWLKPPSTPLTFFQNADSKRKLMNILAKIKSMPKPNPKPRLKSMPKPNPGSKKACQNLTETTKFRCYALNSESEDLKRSAFMPKPIVYAGTLDPFSKTQGSGSSCTVSVPDGAYNFLKPRVDFSPFSFTST